MSSPKLEPELRTDQTMNILETLDLQQIIEQFPLAVIIIDSDWRVWFWNNAAERIFGFEEAHVLNKVLPVIPEENHENFKDLLQRVMAGEVVNEMESEWLAYDDRKIPVSISMAKFEKLTDESSGAVVVVSDCSERKWAQSVLEGTARRLSKLSQMGKSVLSELALWKVLHNLIDQLKVLIPDAEKMAILLKDGSHLKVSALGGDANGDLLEHVLNGETSGWQQFYQDTKVSKLGDRLKESLPGFAEDTEEVFGMVLKAQEQVLGAMLFTCSDQKELSEDAKLMIMDAANWASIAILNAHNHQELQRRLQESRAIMSISLALSETLETDRIFNIIVQNAQEIIPDSDLAAIHLFDYEKGGVNLAASAEKEPGTNKIFLESLPINYVEKVMSQSEPLYIPDVSYDLVDSDPEAGKVSFLAASIVTQDGPVGVISVQSHSANAFSAADIRLLEQLRIEAALALQNANLYQDEKTQREWAEILSQVGAVLTGSVDLDEVLNTILEQISLIIPLSSVHIILIEDEDVVNVRELKGDSIPVGQKMPKSLLDIKNIREIMETGEALVIPDTSNSDKWEYVPESAWIKSYMGIPLKYREDTIGLININSVKPDSFSKGMVHILKSLASYASIAVQNARLVRDLQESLKQEKQMREQLIQSDRLAAMGRMAASIAHEINNPLQGILGCLELAHLSMGEPERQKKYLDMASSALESLNDIVERILSFQRPLQGTMEHTDVRQLLQEVLALSNKKIEHEDITIVLKLDRRMPKAYGIPGQLKQVFLNLTLNAVEAMEPGGTLTISSQKVVMEEPWLQVSFSDTGKGISEEELQHLFEPFYSTKTDGTGLGLWVSQNIIDSHRGRITSESRLGEGTTFTVWLPINPPSGK